MPTGRLAHLVIEADSGQPLPALLAALTPAEQRWVRALPTRARQRQSALARQAAHIALQRLCRAGVPKELSVLPGPRGEPQLRGENWNGSAAVSLSHSGRLAAALAWRARPGEPHAAGVDVERIRSSEVASNPLAFSRAERALLRQAGDAGAFAGLAAWTAKEAAWKAIRSERQVGLDALVLTKLDLVRGHARVHWRRRPRRALEESTFSVTIRVVQGPDGVYLLSVAEAGAHRDSKIRIVVHDKATRPLPFRVGGEYASA